MVEIIELDNEFHWDKIIQSMKEYDFSHLSAYFKLDKSGEAFLFHYSDGEVAFAYPFIKRKIIGTGYFDITSPYGYGGPLTKNTFFSGKDVFSFHSELKKYFDENKIITAFSTLHPLFYNQSLLLKGLGEVIDSNKTIAINLKLSESEQKRQYARSTKYQINRLKRKGVFIKVATSKNEIQSFVSIYRENMDRVNATLKYYFSDEYFYTFLSQLDSIILLAYYRDEIIAGSLCTFCDYIMQAHLNATKTSFLNMSPLKLVIDEARREGMYRNMEWLYLGGGRDGGNDSLFEFKSRFSQLQFQFRVWKYVHNEKIYVDIMNDKFHGQIPQTSFFPPYRFKLS